MRQQLIKKLFEKINDTAVGELRSYSFKSKYFIENGILEVTDEGLIKAVCDDYEHQVASMTDQQLMESFPWFFQGMPSVSDENQQPQHSR